VNEMLANMDQDVFMLDICSALSGNSALSNVFIDSITKLKLLNKIVRMKFTFNVKCELCTKYGVSSGPAIVMIPRHDPEKGFKVFIPGPDGKQVDSTVIQMISGLDKR
jgi:hypothetical protein